VCFGWIIERDPPPPKAKKKKKTKNVLHRRGTKGQRGGEVERLFPRGDSGARGSGKKVETKGETRAHRGEVRPGERKTAKKRMRNGIAQAAAHRSGERNSWVIEKEVLADF